MENQGNGNDTTWRKICFLCCNFKGSFEIYMFKHCNSVNVLWRDTRKPEWSIARWYFAKCVSVTTGCCRGIYTMQNGPLLGSGFSEHTFPWQQICRVQRTNRSRGCSVSGLHHVIKWSSFGSSVTYRWEVVIEKQFCWSHQQASHS
jgi:hypothetical protein